jgi:hypothetical protein
MSPTEAANRALIERVRRHSRRQRILDGFKAAALAVGILAVVAVVVTGIVLFAFWLAPVLVELVRTILWDHHHR